MRSIIIIILSGFSGLVSSQVNQDSLLRKEYWIFLSQDDSVKAFLLNEKAQYLFNSGDIQAGIEEMDRIDNLTLSKIEKNRYRYLKAEICFMNDHFERFLNLTVDSIWLAKNGLNKNYDYMRCISNIEAGEFKEADEILIRNAGDSTARIRVNTLSSEFPEYKDPEKARRLSYFFPGGGLLYAGAPGKAAISFILQGGLLVFTGYNVAGGYFVTAGVSGIFPWSRFFFGGARLAETTAHEKNEERLTRIKKKYLALTNQVFR